VPKRHIRRLATRGPRLHSSRRVVCHLEFRLFRRNDRLGASSHRWAGSRPESTSGCRPEPGDRRTVRVRRSPADTDRRILEPLVWRRPRFATEGHHLNRALAMRRMPLMRDAMTATRERGVDGRADIQCRCSARTDQELSARLRAGDGRPSLIWSVRGRLRCSGWPDSSYRPVSRPRTLSRMPGWGCSKGLDRFEGRASLCTWTFSILINRAKSRGVQESRTMVDLRVAEDDGTDRPTVDPDRFQGPDGRYPGGWTSEGVPGRNGHRLVTASPVSRG
jgi:hypothetical protein